MSLALVRYAAWDARLSQCGKDGVPARAHLGAAAKRGNPFAIKELEGPPFPDALRYIWEWFVEIRRGLGTDLNGLAPLTWLGLDAWARRTGREPEPHEVDVLFTLDSVTRHPALVEEAA